MTIFSSSKLLLLFMLMIAIPARSEAEHTWWSGVTARTRAVNAS